MQEINAEFTQLWKVRQVTRERNLNWEIEKANEQKMEKFYADVL